MSMWNKMTDQAKNLGNQASAMAHKTKLQAEISLIQAKIQNIKQKWGETCFDKYAQGDHASIQQVTLPHCASL